MSEVNPVECIFEVVDFLFLYLDDFKEEEEDLGKEAHQVRNVLQEDGINRKLEYERNEEANEVEQEYSPQELLDRHKLEINDLPDNFKPIPAKMLIILNVHHSGKCLIIEVNKSVLLFED